jgi:hypothetical protein
VWEARKLLGMPPWDELAPAGQAPLPEDPVLQGDSENGDATISMTELACYLLRRAMPRDEVRRLLHRLDAVVLVSRLRTRAEWAIRGKTPVAERVALRVLGTVEVRMDAANLSKFS